MFPLAYFITFRTYGTWLHGDPRGAIDRRHNQVGEPIVAPSPALVKFEQAQMNASAVTLDRRARDTVEASITEVCKFRGWNLHAVNARTNHVHVVVGAACDPGRVLNDLKSYATRGLRAAGLFGAADPVWARGGSKPYLWDGASLAEAMDYVMNRQDDQEWRHNPAPWEREWAHRPGGRSAHPLPDGRGTETRVPTGGPSCAPPP